MLAKPKDLFSKEAQRYANFRPQYPRELYQDIYKHCKEFSCAWDVATGNGQAAEQLVNKFPAVYANDISEDQLRNAKHAKGVYYFNCRAEKTPFQNNIFNLISVAQSFHWLDRDAFYEEIKRTAKKRAILAIWSYHFCKVDDIVDNLLDTLYYTTLKDYWTKEQKIIENQYRAIPLPFEELELVKYDHKLNWQREQLLGYISSWSAIPTYIEKNNQDPIEKITKRINHYWKPEKSKVVHFPIILRIFRIK